MNNARHIIAFKFLRPSRQGLRSLASNNGQQLTGKATALRFLGNQSIESQNCRPFRPLGTSHGYALLIG